MATKILILNHSFTGDLARVYDSILDFRKFGQLHPYMVNVHELNKTDMNGMAYKVNEEVLLLGFLKMRPEYNVEVLEIEKDKHVRYVSNVKGGIVLVIDFNFVYDKNTHQVELAEHIVVKGNRWLIAYFITILKKAHLQLFDNLACSLETKH